MDIMKKIVQSEFKECIEEVIQLFNPYMDDYIYIMDLQKDSYVISKHAMERFGLPAEAFDNAADTHALFVYAEDYPLLQEEFKLILTGQKKAHDLHYRWLDKNGRPIWINCRGGVLDDENGRPHYLIGCINETGKRQRADNISGLLSEVTLSAYMKSWMDEIKSGFLVRIGIDDFSAINSALGIEYGDYVIKNVADCIRKCLSDSQYLFHIVANEYMVVDLKNHVPEDAVALYKAVRGKVSEFIDAEKYKAVFTISAGIVVVEAYEGSYEELIKLSDFALKKAKSNSKNNFYIYDKEDYNIFLRKKKVTAELQHAADNDFKGFDVFYQPIVDSDTSKLIGAEALMRFFMPDGEGMKMVSPVEFIPILEETGLILPVGKWILNESIKMCSEMQQHIPGFKININISYVQVIKSNVLKDIISCMENYKLSAECVGIELTESGYLDSDPHFLKLRNGLRENGVQFIIDDFGTGYSNLHCISELSPSYIKIDRGFTDRAMNNAYDHELMVKIIEMAHNLNIRICVEGVEERAVHEEVKKIHADYIQGYLFGKPCNKADFYEKFV